MKLNVGLLMVLMGWSGAGVAATPKFNAPHFDIKTEVLEKSVEIKVTPPAAHHFNIKAPMSLRFQDGVAESKLKPVKATEKEIRFKLPKPDIPEIKLTLYLCDDKNTYCEKHSVKATRGEKGQYVISQASGENAPSHLDRTASASAEVQLDHGFILNNSKHAFEKARKENKPLLIEFFAIWCPPCNRMDQDVLSSKEFQRESAQFVKLKMDGDHEAAWEMKSKYLPRGYPTFIFANSNGEQIEQIAGYFPKSVFLKKMKRAAKSQADSFQKLIAKADRGDLSASDRVGLIYFEQSDFDQAKKYLAGSKVNAEKFHLAEAGYWKRKKKQGDKQAQKEADDQLIAVYEKMALEFPDSVEAAIDSRSELASIYESKKQTEKQKQVLEGMITAARVLMKKPQKLAEQGYQTSDLWYYIADAEETLGRSQAAKETWKSAAEDLMKLARAEKDRGYQSSAAYCYGRAGDLDTADRTYRKLQETFPHEFSYYYKEAQLYFDLKDFEKAKNLLNRALQYTYGDNRLKTVQLLAQAYKALGQRKEAQTLIDKTLKNTAVPKDETLATFRYISKLKEISKTL